MTAQIMRSEFDPYQFSGFNHHHPGGFIRNREYSVIGGITNLQCVFPQSIRHFLRDENEFVFLAAFGLTKDQFAVLQIAQLQFQHFTDAHAAAGHQLENQSIANLGSPENDLINSFLFDDFPSQWHPFPIKLADHRPVSWVTKLEIDIVADEIEKGRELGITNSLGVRFVAVYEAVKKG